MNAYDVAACPEMDTITSESSLFDLRFTCAAAPDKSTLSAVPSSILAPPSVACVSSTTMTGSCVFKLKTGKHQRAMEMTYAIYHTCDCQRMRIVTYSDTNISLVNIYVPVHSCLNNISNYHQLFAYGSLLTIQNIEIMEDMFQSKKKRKFRSDRGDALILDNSRIPAPKRDRPQYLYVDPNFLCQVTRPRAGNQSDDYYDCTNAGECQSQMSNTGGDIVEEATEPDPKNFKCLLREVAFTTHVLYKAFSKAYHKSAKAQKRQGSYCTCTVPSVREVVGDSQQGPLLDSAKTPSTTNNVMESQHMTCKPSKAISVKRHKCIRMEPVAFSVPLKLLVESPTCCETVTTEILMEAFGEPLCICGKSKRRKIEEEPIRTATIAADYFKGGAVGTSGIDQYQAFLENLRSHDLQNVPSQNIPETQNKSEKYLPACSCHASKIQHAIKSGAGQESCQAVFEFVKPERMENLQQPISATVFKVGSEVYFSCASSEDKLHPKPSMKSINGNVYDLLKRYHSSQTSIHPPHMLRSIASYDFDDYVIAPRSKRPYKQDAIKPPKSFEYPSKVKRLSTDIPADHLQVENEPLKLTVEQLEPDDNKVSHDTQTYPPMAHKEQESNVTKDQKPFSTNNVSQDTQTEPVYMKGSDERESEGPLQKPLKVSQDVQTDSIKICSDKPRDELLQTAAVDTQTEPEELERWDAEPSALMKTAVDATSDKTAPQREVEVSPEMEPQQVTSDVMEIEQLEGGKKLSDKLLTERINSMAWFKSREKELRGDLKTVQTQTEGPNVVEDFKDIGDQPREDDFKPEERVEDFIVPFESLEPTPVEKLEKRHKVEEGTQTEVTSFQGGHNKRKALRIQILANLRCFADPTENNNQCAYTPDDKEQIEKDLHKILAPRKASRKTQQEIRDTIVEDLRYLFTPLPESQRKGIPQTTTLTPERPNELKTIDDLRHVLDPRTGVKPEHYFTKTEQEKLLDLLSTLLKPRNIPENQINFETRESLIKEIRKILESRSDKSLRFTESSDSEKGPEKGPDAGKSKAEDANPKPYKQPEEKADIPMESTQEITSIQTKNLLERVKEQPIMTEGTNTLDFSFGSSSTMTFSDAEIFEMQSSPRKPRINEEAQTEPLMESFSTIFIDVPSEKLSKLTEKKSIMQTTSTSYIERSFSKEDEVEYEPSAKRRRPEPPIPPPKPKKSRKRSFSIAPDNESDNILDARKPPLAKEMSHADVVVYATNATQTELSSFSAQMLGDIEKKKYSVSSFLPPDEMWIENNKHGQSEYEDMEREANKENDDKIPRQKPSRSPSSRQTLEEKLRKLPVDASHCRTPTYGPPEMFENKRERWKPQEDFRPFNISYDRSSVPKVTTGKTAERKGALKEQKAQLLGASQTSEQPSIRDETIGNVSLHSTISGFKTLSKESVLSKLKANNESMISQKYPSHEPSHVDLAVLKSLYDLNEKHSEINKIQKRSDQIKTNSTSKLSVGPTRIDSFEPTLAIVDVSANTLGDPDIGPKTLEKTSSSSKAKLPSQRDKQRSPQPRDFEFSSFSIQRQSQNRLADRFATAQDYPYEKLEKIDDLNASPQIYHRLQQESNYNIENDLNKKDKECKEKRRTSPTVHEIPSPREQLQEFAKHEDYSIPLTQSSQKRFSSSSDHEHVRGDTSVLGRRMNESYVARMASEIMKFTSFATLENTAAQQEELNFAKSNESQIFAMHWVPSQMYKHDDAFQRPDEEVYIKPRPLGISTSREMQQGMHKQDDVQFIRSSDSHTSSLRSPRKSTPLVYQSSLEKHKQELFLKLNESELQQRAARSTKSSESEISTVSQNSISRMRRTLQKIAEDNGNLQNEISIQKTLASSETSVKGRGSSQNSQAKTQSTLPKIPEVNINVENETFAPAGTKPNKKPDSPDDDAKKT
uniref:Uncharacterized protein n=1 Tax=Glossina pallidipes TaxID=7398 RepID=A0A1B0AFD6_GLOPL